MFNRKNWKRGLLFLFALSVVSSAMLFAQGGKEPASVKDTKPIELVYWSHYGQSPTFVQSFADASNLALKNLGYDNVTCRAEVIEYSGYMAKYLSAFASGNGPDIFLAAPSDWALDGGANPIALPLPVETAKIWDNALAGLYSTDGYFHGTRYGFPAEGGSIQFLYINDDYMKEAGLDPKTDYPKTMEELRAVAKKLTKYDADGTILRAGYAPRNLGGGGGVSGKFLSFLHQYGARVLSEDLSKASGYINSEISKKAFQDYQDMVYVDKSVNLKFGAPEAAFQSGQAAIITREGWFAKDCLTKAPNINFSVVPFISESKNVAATQGGGAWVNMINSQSDYKDICVELFGELAKPEYDVILHEAAGYPPVLKATMTLENAYFSQLPYAHATIDSLDKGPASLYDANPLWSSLTSLVGDSVAAIMGGANVDKELDTLAAKMDVILSEN